MDRHIWESNFLRQYLYTRSKKHSRHFPGYAPFSFLSNCAFDFGLARYNNTFVDRHNYFDYIL